MLLFLLLLPLCGAVEVKRPRGVSLTNHHFYDESKPFTCLDGSATVPFYQVNDDYCDCKDGSDEPGTAACPNGSFHCTNTGYKPLYISSTWVNDGVCDCCDGTDEYNSGIICENTCKEKGRKERETLQQLAEVTREGVRLKKILIEEWKKSREEKQNKLVELQDGKTSLAEQVELLRATKEEAEKLEKEAKDEHRRLWEEQLAQAQSEQEHARLTLIFQELDTNMDEWISVAELQTHTELDTDGDGTFSEEEAQALLGGDTQVDRVTFFDRIWVTIKDKYRSEALPPEQPAPTAPDQLTHPAEQEQQEVPPVPHEEEEEEEEEEQHEEEEEEPEEEEELEEEAQDPGEQPPKEAPSPLAPPPPTGAAHEDPTAQMPPYDAHTEGLINAAQKARSEFEEAERSLKDMQETIRNLEQEISFDFGPNGEFSYLYSQCYELATNEYVYRLCPFKLVSQKPKLGGSPTNLGTWGSWAGPDHDKYSAMKYEQGTGCWQGPNRSTTVRLLCGKETSVTSTTEPSRCEYLMELTTPAACPDLPPELPNGDHDEL